MYLFLNYGNKEKNCIYSFFNYGMNEEKLVYSFYLNVFDPKLSMIWHCYPLVFFHKL